MKATKAGWIVVMMMMAVPTFAQLTVQGEFRPRYEYRHGFKTLFPDAAEAAMFVSQRTRLNTKYQKEDLTFYLSMQDIRVWGDVSQLNTADRNGWAVHEAWSRFKVGNKVYAKLGRQELVYDDHRMLGSVAWAQQARSHDAAVLQYSHDGKTIHLGGAFNQTGEGLTGTYYTGVKNYKAMQFAWFNHKWENTSASVLFLNNGMQYSDSSMTGTVYSQTVGTHLKHKRGNLSLAANAYYQMGLDANNNALNAYLASVDGKYQLNKQFGLGFGTEIISGNDDGVISNGVNTAFTPFYGTNHKFNGLMDYFYVGNHANNVGLIDMYGSLAYTTKGMGVLKMDLHQFMTAGSYAETNLGMELDIVYSRKLQEDVFMKVGYSQLFKGPGMDILKGATSATTNNWAWVMITVKPTLFSN